MDNKKCKVINISEDKRFPGIIYAELREVDTNHLMISATLPYILESIRERKLDCINTECDRFGNLFIKL